MYVTCNFVFTHFVFLLFYLTNHFIMSTLFLTAWFRAVRFLELMAFFGIISLIGVIIAYMFCLRDVKYVFVQWIIVGLCFGTGR